MGGAIIAAALACSDSSSPGSSGGLSGTYTLDTLLVDTGPVLTPPVATGSAQFSAPSQFLVILQLHPPATPKDSTIGIPGTYKFAATDSIYLTVLGGVFTIPGTHAESGNRLDLNILVPPGFIGSDTTATTVHLAWHK